MKSISIYLILLIISCSEIGATPTSTPARLLQSSCMQLVNGPRCGSQLPNAGQIATTTYPESNPYVAIATAQRTTSFTNTSQFGSWHMSSCQAGHVFTFMSSANEVFGVSGASLFGNRLKVRDLHKETLSFFDDVSILIPKGSSIEKEERLSSSAQSVLKSFMTYSVHKNLNETWQGLTSRQNSNSNIIDQEALKRIQGSLSVLVALHVQKYPNMPVLVYLPFNVHNDRVELPEVNKAQCIRKNYVILSHGSDLNHVDSLTVTNIAREQGVEDGAKRAVRFYADGEYGSNVVNPTSMVLNCCALKQVLMDQQEARS